MKRIWLWLVPDLAKVHHAMRDDALSKASRSGLTSGELITMVIWLLIVSIMTSAILSGATNENRVAFTIVTNLIFTAPALLAVFIPIHLRRIRRDIRRQLKQ
jgi:hypothetical protein